MQANQLYHLVIDRKYIQTISYYLVLSSKAALPADQDTALDFVCCIIINYLVLDCAADKNLQCTLYTKERIKSQYFEEHFIKMHHS